MMAMKKRLASLVLLLVLADGAFAGLPLHFGEQSCSMGEAMGQMDCCKAALMQHETPEVDAARLCCALNCAQNGTTSPPSVIRVTPPSRAAQATHPLTLPVLYPRLPLGNLARSHGPPGSQPAYILNLALLI